MINGVLVMRIRQSTRRLTGEIGSAHGAETHLVEHRPQTLGGQGQRDLTSAHITGFRDDVTDIDQPVVVGIVNGVGSHP